MNLRRRLPILAAAVMLVLAVGCSNNNAEVEKLRKENEALKAVTPVATSTATATAPPAPSVTPAPAPTMSAPAQSPGLVMMTETEACSVAQFEYIKNAYKTAARVGGKWVVGDCTKTGSEVSATQTRWLFSAPVTFTWDGGIAPPLVSVDYMQVTDFGGGRYTTTFGRRNQ